MGYVELSALKKSLELTGETFVDDDLRLAISTASTSVESMCRRDFAAPGDADVTRTYVPTRHDWFEIDDAVSVSLIDADLYDSGEFTIWDPTDFRLEPINGPADGVPYTAVRLNYYSAVGPFDPHCGMIRVTGKFGWPEVPDPIRQATSILAARLIKRVREAPFGVAGSGIDGQAVRITRSDPDVAMLVSPYRRAGRLA